ISGSSTPAYNGTFTVVSATSSSFVITAAFTGTNASSSWTRNGGVLSGCATTGATGAITLAATPSRIVGVAPLAVFFDASATTAPATARPFHNLEYSWTFGDTTAGSWGDKATGSSGSGNLVSRNAAKGPVAAHVFETPGAYTISLTVTDGTNQVSNSCVQIAVQDPNVVFSGTSTVCYSNASNFAGCPTGAIQIGATNSWPTVVASATTGKRILLNGGDIFSGPASAALSSVAGPGIIGAYGSGKPIIQTTGTSNNSTILLLTGSNSDWRIVNLEIDGQSDIHRQAILGGGSASMNQMLFMNLYIHDIGGAIELPLQSAAAVYDQLTLTDSSIRRLVGGNPTSASHGILSGGSRTAILGNLFDDSITSGNAEHMIRIQYMDRGVIGHNQIDKVQVGKEMLTLRAPCSSACPGPAGSNNYFPALGLSGAAAATRKVVIADNLIQTNTYVGVALDQVSPNDSTLIQDVILERNYYQTQANAAGSAGIEIRGSGITVRNEIVDISNSGSLIQHNGITVDAATAGMAAGDTVNIYNNTIYSGSAGDFFGIVLGAGTTNITAMNNLGYAPGATTSIVMVRDLGSTSPTLATNTTTPSTSPNFVGPLNSPSGFKLGASYAKNSGTAVPVFSDFFGNIRPDAASHLYDLGATEQ
ncbi:MAG: hypothetical protein JSR19_03660, partial [Proteobacteria bacterium]|nr:hypothetical protein [Pseudomonadota bacterium]